MPTNPFVILGVSKEATQSEILEAYKAKRAYYQEHVFDEGESGSNAARMLEQLDEAYQQAMEYAVNNATVEEKSTSLYSDIKDAIKSKDVERAQRLLDDMSTRGAEWHYFQSIVFYQKSWLNDSKKQLEIAIQMDPDNEKYKTALEKLKKNMDGTRPFDKDNGSSDVYNRENASYHRQERTYSPDQGTASDGCCAACEALWCADCCCECLGGDLIRCC